MAVRKSALRKRRITRKDAAAQRWHPCDEFIVPLIKAIDAANTDKPDEDAIANVRIAARGPIIPLSLDWLALNVSPDYAREFEYIISGLRVADEFCNGIRQEEFFRKAMERIHNEDDLFLALQRYAGKQFERDLADAATAPGDHRANVRAAIQKHTQAITNPDREAALVQLVRIDCERHVARNWQMIRQRELAPIREKLDCIRHMLRGRVSIEALALKPHFVPTEMQLEILAALNGSAFTADDLMGEMDVSRDKLYGGKSRKGGLIELMNVGLVENRHKVGYFRPDAPPKNRTKRVL
jgi:hypothetical protein